MSFQLSTVRETETARRRLLQKGVPGWITATVAPETIAIIGRGLLRQSVADNAMLGREIETPDTG